MNFEEVNRNTLDMLDCQVDVILKSLEFYAYTYQFIYPRSSKPKTKEEELRISLIRDTYEQILSCLDKPITRNPVVMQFLKENEKTSEKILNKIA